MGCCWACCKKLLKLVETFIGCIVTTILLVIGLVTFTSGLVLNSFLSDDSKLSWMVPLLISAGVFILLAAILFMASHCAKCIWQLIPLVVAVGCLVLAIILEISYLTRINQQAISVKDFILDNNLTDIRGQMKQYHTDIPSRIFWDVLQLKSECCGLESVQDWKDIGEQIPVTCCKEYSPDVWLEDNKDYLNTTEGKAALVALDSYAHPRRRDARDAGHVMHTLAVVPDVISCDKTVESNLKSVGCFEKMEEYFQTAMKWFKVLLYFLIVFLVGATIFYVYFIVKMLAKKIAD